MKACPLVLASFSGGPKACMYKVLQVTVAWTSVNMNGISLDDKFIFLLQIIEGKCEFQLNLVC